MHKTVSKSVHRARKQRYKRLRKLRKARDIASQDAVLIRRRKKEVWKLKDIVTHFQHREPYLFLDDLAKEIFDANGIWLYRAPKPPSRPVVAKK
ncbi:hypothetical protein [Lysinibacillus sp. NPDC059133]|uniref:hypothetical protein n=1 Tax=Lysinibacillus sp. NPDC059133 TaxID=3346737 RepID=UPI00369D45B8